MSFLKPKPKIDLSCLDGMVVPAHVMRKRTPDLSCLDGMIPPVTKRSPYVTGPPAGTAHAKQGRTPESKEKDRIGHAKRNALRTGSNHTPTRAEIEAEISKIRRVKDVLRSLGRESPADDLSHPSTEKDETLS